jgi:NAD(P)-dependent dehydrogenase (short-subunit alcohol dehydrogenase family)
MDAMIRSAAMHGAEKPLAGRVALVAGATRGAGRGIARMLGEAGATVYCSGRGSREAPSAAGAHAGRPETVEDTADLVGAAGGEGIAVRVDHAREDEVAALVGRIQAERGRLDILVNVLGGTQAPGWGTPFWKLPVDQGRALVESWVWPHVITCRQVAPVMVKQKSGLIVEVVEGETIGYRPPFYFDLALVALKRLAFGLAEEMAPHGVAVIAAAPGFMRTEEILAQFGATEETWREVAESSPEARGFGFAGSETPCFVGRAVAALASDPQVMRRSGGLYPSWELADAYGFTDVDGASPRWGRYLAENFPQFAGGATATGFRWELAVPAAKPEVLVGTG